MHLAAPPEGLFINYDLGASKSLRSHINPHPVVKKLHLNLVLWGARGPRQLS